MELQIDSFQDITILTIRGSIHAHTVQKLQRQLDALAATQPAKVVVSLAHVNFMDSSGLSALVQGMKKCRKHGGDLCLCSPQQPVRMILELTRLDKAIEIFASEVDAIASFGSNH